MVRHYNAREFFRQMPSALLARYFSSHQALADVDFSRLKDGRPEELFAAWLELSEDLRNRMDAECKEIFSLSCESSWRAIRDEAHVHLAGEPERLMELITVLSALPGHAERAMVTFLDHGKYWQGATMFFHAVTLSWWRKRKGLPLSERRDPTLNSDFQRSRQYDQTQPTERENQAEILCLSEGGPDYRRSFTNRESRYSDWA